MNSPINDSNDQEYLTKDELAARLKVCVRTVVRWMKKGRVPFNRWGTKTVRFKWSKVQQVLEARERQQNAAMEAKRSAAVVGDQ